MRGKLIALMSLVFFLCTSSGVALAEEEQQQRRPVRTEWIIDGALAVAWIALAPAAFQDPRTDSRIGPVFRGPEDVDALARAAEAGTIGRPLVDEETVTDTELILWSLGGLDGALLLAYVLAPLIDTDDQELLWYGEQAIAMTVGALQAVLGTFVLTEAVKNGVGRLRPDFADRADRYYCHLDDVPELYRPRCSSLEASGTLGPAVDAATVRRGRRSFWSGHAATSAAALTFGALFIGGRMVWGRSATALTRAVGIICQAAALAGALFIAQSRVTDGVHHAEDVWVGSAVGFGLASLGYWLHFDRHGEVRRNISLQAAPTDDGVAIAIGGFL